MPNQLPPNQLPPNQSPPNQLPPNQLPPNQLPPNQLPPNQLPPNQLPPNQFPPNQFPPLVSRSPSVAVRLPLLALSTVLLASSRTTPTVPRLSAIEPVPVEGATPTLATPGSAVSAAPPSTIPLPTAIGSVDASWRAVCASMNLMRSGDSVGFAEIICATSPVTTAVAIDVPEPRRYGAAIVLGNCVVIAAPGAASETMCPPGATTSVFAKPSAAVGPRPVKFGRTSSFSPLVPLSSIAPTVTTNGASAGLLIVPADGPRLEAATLTTTPACQAFSTE